MTTLPKRKSAIAEAVKVLRALEPEQAEFAIHLYHELGNGGTAEAAVDKPKRKYRRRKKADSADRPKRKYTRKAKTTQPETAEAVDTVDDGGEE